MGLLLYLILLAISGLIVGALARLALPGPDPMGIGTTILIGIAGSFIGGLLMALLFRRNGAGIVVSVLCATAIVYLIRRSRGGSLTDPGLGPRRRRYRARGRSPAGGRGRAPRPRAADAAFHDGDGDAHHRVEDPPLRAMRAQPPPGALRAPRTRRERQMSTTTAKAVA